MYNHNIIYSTWLTTTADFLVTPFLSGSLGFPTLTGAPGHLPRRSRVAPRRPGGTSQRSWALERPWNPRHGTTVGVAKRFQPSQILILTDVVCFFEKNSCKCDSFTWERDLDVRVFWTWGCFFLRICVNVYSMRYHRADYDCTYDVQLLCDNGDKYKLIVNCNSSAMKISINGYQKCLYDSFLKSFLIVCPQGRGSGVR